MVSPPLVDTHCHLNFGHYDADREAVLARARWAGIARFVVPATDLPGCREALDLAAQNADIYAAVGIHPNSAAGFGDGAMDELRVFAQDKNAVAIGEIGLDYYWDRCPRSLQIAAFEAQLALAARLELPVILHSRESGEDLLAVLKSWVPTLPPALKSRAGVWHSYSSSDERARRAIELGFYLGFSGPLTYKNADIRRGIATNTPLDRLLVETDAPFLAPQQRRGKRNEPAFVRFINEKLADLHGVSRDEMARQTTANAERLFAWT